jgi:hypothetical protein
MSRINLRLSSVHLGRGDECFLRNVDLAELAHLILASLLLFEQLALSGGAVSSPLSGRMRDAFN